MSLTQPKSAKDLCEDFIKSNPVSVFGTSQCKYTTEAIQFFNHLGTPFDKVFLDERDDGTEMKTYLQEKTNYNKTPLIFIGEEFVGGLEDVKRELHQGKLDTRLKQAGIHFTQPAGGEEVDPGTSQKKLNEPEEQDPSKQLLKPEQESKAEAESRGGRIPAEVGVEKL